MKALFLYVLCILILPTQAFAQELGENIYPFANEAGHYDYVEIDAERRLKTFGVIRGYIQITSCNRHEKWGSGTRFKFENENEDVTYYFGIACRRNSDVLAIEWALSEGEAEGLEDSENELLPLKIGDKVTFEIVYENGIVIFTANNTRFKKEIPFQPKTIQFFSFGTDGLIHIFEDLS